MERLIKNNKLIADFIGASKTSNCKDNEMFIPSQTICRIDTIELGKGHILKFHKSWDWLMPIVEKINLLDNYKYTVYIASMDTRIEDNITGKNIIDVSCKHAVEELRESVYEAVVKFIEWYNWYKTYK